MTKETMTKETLLHKRHCDKRDKVAKETLRQKRHYTKETERQKRQFTKETIYKRDNLQ